MLEELHQGSPSGELNWRRKKALVSPGEGEWRSKRDTGQLFPPITCYPTHGKKLAQRGDCKISRRCSVSPSPQLYRCLPERRRAHRMRQHSVWSEIGTPRRWHPLSVGQPLLGDSLPFLLTSVADKELLSASKAPGAVHVYAQCSYGTQQRQGWICLLRGQCLQVHHLIAEERGGNLRHVSRPGSQDNVRVNGILTELPESQRGLARGAWGGIAYWQDGSRARVRRQRVAHCQPSSGGRSGAVLAVS